MTKRFKKILTYKNKERSKIQGSTSTPINDTSVLSTDLTSQPNPSQQPRQDISDSEILDTVPKQFKNQAWGILNWVRKSPDVISWDNKGTVAVDGKPSRVIKHFGSRERLA
jgi:hypothetical protein